MCLLGLFTWLHAGWASFYIEQNYFMMFISSHLVAPCLSMCMSKAEDKT